ncbi:anthranilate phosphoribosyltransferase [Gramella lutea]|uniref:Anthranilate phosphoribosyltransferase n=1 Tax=Christiangramia lutea TaxID=1607951 RepID=A0A9X1V464_9FLAO|nr:anthranilate phosphoribosyltransferase [Christiangramia lutea]MCH4824132.1 anthranilate phosphoribosyltransferase [Christiangramia lutea]
MKELLNRLISHETISTEEAKQVIFNISEGKYNETQIAAFLTVYMMRSITIEELEGFRDALLELCIKVDLSGYEAVDLCGSGGDGKDTFNISTTSSFVTAGAGVKVAKHGNYGVSSVSGSSNVMEYLGIKFSNDAGFLEKCIDEANICILHAPLFHPAMKNVAPVRKSLAVKTFFNMLGPMVNPAFPKNQLVGVFSLELARMYAYLYQNTNKNYTILHALDGYDEISLTGETKSISNNSERVLKATDFGVSELKQAEIAGGGSIESSAEILTNILKGKGTQAQNNVVCANAGMAIATSRSLSPQDGFAAARESLESGKAFESFKKLQELSQI